MPDLVPEIRSPMLAYIGGIVRSQGSTLLAAGGMPDHVHCLIGLQKTLALSDLLRLVKTNSCRWIHETFPAMENRFAWQTGYGAFSVSYSHLQKVKTYIDNQESHHRAISFQNEYRAFLNRHGISFDERYVWD